MSVLATEPGAGVLKRPAAGQDQCRTEPQQMRNSNMLPVQARTGAGEVYDADGDEESGNRNQSQAHGQQTGAGNMAAIPVLVFAFVVVAASAITARVDVMRPSTIRASQLY